MPEPCRSGSRQTSHGTARRAAIIRHRHGRPWHQARRDRAVRQPHQRPALRRRRNLQQKPADARTQSRVGEMGGAYWAPHQRRAGEEGGEIAHGAKVTGPRRTRRGGGVPVVATNDERVRATPETPRVRALTPDETRAWADIATDDEHYCEHVKDFRRAWIGAVAVAYGEHLAAAAGPIDEREAAYRASVENLPPA